MLAQLKVAEGAILLSPQELLILDFNCHTSDIVELLILRQLRAIFRKHKSRRVLYGPRLIQLMYVRKLLLELLPIIVEISQ